MATKDELTYKCTLCGYIAQKKYNLERHSRTHTNPFKCSFCDFTAFEKNTIKRHVSLIHPTTALSKQYSNIPGGDSLPVHPIKIHKRSLPKNGHHGRKQSTCNKRSKVITQTVMTHPISTPSLTTSTTTTTTTSALPPPSILSFTPSVTTKISDAHRCVSCNKFSHRMCGNNMCSTCCGTFKSTKNHHDSTSPIPLMCEFHTKVRNDYRAQGVTLLAKLNDDDKYLVRRKIGRDVMKESAFKFVGETLTVFSLQDFLNSKFSKEIVDIQLGERKKRIRDAQRSSKRR